MPSRFAGAIGAEFPEVTATVDRGRLAYFAQVIGETNPVYSDVNAARSAGHPDIPAPPTFLYGMIGGVDGSLAWLAKLGVDSRNLLHGEQHFTYHQIAHAGDTLRLKPRLSKAYSKRGGELEFLVRDTTVQREDGANVADLRETLVVRFGRETS